ncbi:MAG: glycosyltransferase family 39 protein [Microbacterium sp.]|nr:glycosyltransferase family 39 protein [Microbacterium sp.]
MSDYYASIALSMSESWSNFFFGALDPAGTVTLDKIPGSFWIPALFVKAFGFSPWAVIVPNALAATASVVITAFTARRWAGPVAGLTAGGIVATTPILVAVARSNQPETFFVLCLALTAWAATKALERRSLGWLVLAGVFIAAGFQTYMLEAWAVWPALAAAYLCTRQSWRRRLGHLAVAGTVSLALSLTWIVAVSLIPASDRPYVGSTLTDSPWEMVFGYNGLGRFGTSTADASAYRSFTPPFSGEPSALRLLNENLAAQIGWMLPVAVAAVVILFVLRFRRALTVFAAVWFATFAAMFSVVAGMHQFYTAALAVPTALLIGTAFAQARRRRALWAQLVLVGTAAATAVGIGLFANGGAAFAVPTALAQLVLALVAGVLLAWEWRRAARMPLAAAVAAVALVLSPAVWSAVTVTTPNSTNPVAAGVAAMSGGGGGGGFAGAAPATGRRGTGSPGHGAQTGVGPAPAGGTTTPGRGAPNGVGLAPTGGTTTADTQTVAWLAAHADGRTYRAAVFGAQAAARLIIASDGGSFLPIGGFNGGDPVPTLDAFQRLVANGDVVYVIAAGGDGRGVGTAFGAGNGNGARTSTAAAAATTSGEIRSWVLANCSAVTDAPISDLYDCAG